MHKCCQCDVEKPDKDLLYDKDQNVCLCRGCFVGALVGGTANNKALSYLMRHNSLSGMAANKAANLMFEAQKKVTPKPPLPDIQPADTV